MKKLKITSLILVAVMVIGMLPLGMLSISAAETLPPNLPNSTSAYRTSGYLSTSKTLAGGDNYITPLTAQWRGTDGILLKVTGGDAASELNPQLVMERGQGSNTSSYIRFIIASDSCFSTIFGYQTSTVWLYDGANWTSQTTDNISGNSVANYVTIPANFDGYLYLPLDQFWFYGPGARGSISSDTNPYLYQTKFVDYVANSTYQKIKLNLWGNTGASVTVSKIDFAFNEKDLAPASTDVTAPMSLTSYSHSNNNAIAKTGNWNAETNTLTLSGVQTSNGTGVLCWTNFSDKYTDLSDVKGLMVNVDTTGANGTVHFRMFLQCKHGWKDGIYSSGSLIANYNADNNVLYTNNSSTASWMQWVTRSAGSVAYIKNASNQWEAIYAEGTTYTAANESAFTLPKDYNGPVYIPMDSYYLTLENNSSATMISWEASLIKDVGAIGYSPYVTDVPQGASATVAISEPTFVYEGIETVEIGTAKQLLTFLNNLEDYEGKKVVLTSDITLNEGWDASAETVTEPATKLNPTDKTFAGIFDGRGHTISGLYLKTETNETGFFGNVPTGKTATVKNVTILNSYIESNQPATGGIFGTVQAESTKKITDPHYVNKTKAYLKDIYADIHIVNTFASRGAGDGVGGLIGCCQTDADIQNCVFAGDIVSSGRGVGAMIGAVYQPQESSHNTYLTDIRIVNSMFIGSLSVTNQEFVGAIVGYINPNTLFMKVDRFSSYGSVNAAATANTVRNGILVGGSWCSMDKNRDGIGTDRTYIILTNTTYIQNGNVTDVFGASGAGVIVYLNNKYTQYTGAIDQTKLAPLTAADLPDVLMIRGELQWEQSATLNANGTLSMNFFLKADQLVLKEGGKVYIKIRPGASGTDAETQTIEAVLGEDGFYKVSILVDWKRAGDEMKVELLTKAPDSAATQSTTIFHHESTDVRPSVKKYMMALIEDENQSDAVKNLAADILRYADLCCDQYLATIPAEDTTTYKTPVVLNAAEEAALTAGSSVTFGTDPVIVGTAFTSVTFDATNGTFTVKANANSGACSATFGGEAVIMNLASNGDLTVTVGADNWLDIAKTLVVTNGTSSVTVSYANFLDPENVQHAETMALVRLATSILAFQAAQN